MENVTFATTSMDVIKALHKPKDWPAYVGHIAELLTFVQNHLSWDILFKFQDCNRGAFEIAKSVVVDLRIPSYVAQGAPRWIRELFAFKKKNVIVYKS